VTKRTNKKTPQAHRFGGDWTSDKLGVLESYLSRYTTALKDTSFRKAYIDAFAGTGYREVRGDPDAQEPDALLFPDLAENEPQELLDGSARLALKTEPRFDRYIFIERSKEHCEQLETLRDEFPELAEDIIIKLGDANMEIQGLCKKDWRRRRAVMFLDPYGMQVEWKTIEAIAKTKAIDLWVLFPLGSRATYLERGGSDSTCCSVRRTGMTSFTKWSRSKLCSGTMSRLSLRQRQRPLVATSTNG
jgi:three-Cys-motif partner protein